MIFLIGLPGVRLSNQATFSPCCLYLKELLIELRLQPGLISQRNQLAQFHRRLSRDTMNRSPNKLEFELPNHQFQVAPFDDQTAAEIWNKYFERLLRFATTQMRGMPKIASDEEDITLSVLKSVCLSIRDGRISEIDEDTRLWKLLVVICKRKIANQYAYQRRGKRDVSKSQSIDDDSALLHELQSKEILPDLFSEFNERLENLFGQLEKEPLKKIALLKIQGYTNEEIAHNMECSLSTIERKLRVIRSIWSREYE